MSSACLSALAASPHSQAGWNSTASPGAVSWNAVEGL
ncbi:Uncharacterised protein [Bordetella pertussis]|nr:Uncharacterised protein [Bordetella pertussis]CFM01923.1 Uncharacterised protein [Bordetella pertussis]CFM24555.1 Uncharacterised protein [Bordetella pertussis]CFM49744.1 Uncharacterised protein [Bordetella pertussis]CFM57361.1 Uncharacterised protein [Bordetella pertussis]